MFNIFDVIVVVTDQQDLVPTNNPLFIGHINCISIHSSQSYYNVKINEIPLFGIIYIILLNFYIKMTFFIFLLTQERKKLFFKLKNND